MATLRDSIATFKTGDLVFTRYPPKGVQPIHVTLSLEPRNALGRSYVHAGATQLEIADVSTYEVDKNSGGYLHAHPVDPPLRAKTADVAQLFAQTVTRTPYGDYPGTKDFARLNLAVQSPHASRFTGMIHTTDFAQIPFEFPALRRLLKWTMRAIDNAPLSENRGTTCAAFVSICHQVARMLMFLEECGVLHQVETIRKCVQRLDTLVESKASLRENLVKLGEDTIFTDLLRKGPWEGAGEPAPLKKDVDYSNLPSTTTDRLTIESDAGAWDGRDVARCESDAAGDGAGHGSCVFRSPMRSLLRFLGRFSGRLLGSRLMTVDLAGSVLAVSLGVLASGCMGAGDLLTAVPDAGSDDTGTPDAGVMDAGPPDAFATCDPPALTYASFGQAFLTNYCASCHAFDQSVVKTSGSVLASAVTSGAMPRGGRFPTAAERMEFAAWIACGAP